ncbi:MAG: hypothetical protein COV36_00755 [Alphaproteobacteria bacterium CG11_big_fil_rev_8_21_14_0_20_44_7]|nr:MAG: hypothetical protein COV36_00755 [Alphaproteobacteria bacterium CG11_big_fil_rev_8_21_14_0_20_44_7]
MDASLINAMNVGAQNMGGMAAWYELLFGRLKTDSGLGLDKMGGLLDLLFPKSFLPISGKISLFSPKGGKPMKPQYDPAVLAEGAKIMASQVFAMKAHMEAIFGAGFNIHADSISAPEISSSAEFLAAKSKLAGVG